MNRDLPHLVSQVFNTPLLIQAQKLDTVLGSIGARLLAGHPIDFSGERPAAAANSSDGGATSGVGYYAGAGVGVLPILGTLVRRGSWMDSMSGMTSYASIQNSFTELMGDAKIQGVLLEIDSFGGEAGGVFDLVASMKAAAAHYEKPVWAVVNENGMSAGYALACAAEKIWLPQMGAVGSIGVVCAHVDMSKADEKEGLKWTYIYAGDHKTDGNPHEPLSGGAKALIQADVDSINGAFLALVADARGLTIEGVRNMQARSYRCKDAIAIGLADKRGTVAECVNAFASFLAAELESPSERLQFLNKDNDQMSSQAKSSGWAEALERAAARRELSVTAAPASSSGALMSATAPRVARPTPPRPAPASTWGAALERVCEQKGLTPVAPGAVPRSAFAEQMARLAAETASRG